MSEPPVQPKIPPGWPIDVPPPGTEGWEDSAARWLIQWMPSGYRRYPVLREEPKVLVAMARTEVESSLHAARRGYSTTRKELAEAGLDPAVIEQALAVYAEEGARLSLLSRQVGLIADALIRGVRWRRSSARPADAERGRRRGGMG